jgi:hypothetical protein
VSALETTWALWRHRVTRGALAWEEGWSVTPQDPEAGEVAYQLAAWWLEEYQAERKAGGSNAPALRASTLRWANAAQTLDVHLGPAVERLVRWVWL